jgi:hypothetical protein
MAAPIDADGFGATGSPADGCPASSAQTWNETIKTAAKAAVANILLLNLIVASRTARRDSQDTQRRHNSTRMEHTKQRIA